MVKVRRKEGKRENKRKKRKKRKEKRKRKKKEKKRLGRCETEKGEKKKGTVLPFTIFGEPVVEMRQGKRQSRSMRLELRVGTRNWGFRHVPKGRCFSYIGYFLPRGHVKAILVQL